MLLRCWRLEHVQGGLPKTWGRGKWEGIGARLEGCSLPGCCGSLNGTGRAEGTTGFLPCAAVAALLAKPRLGTHPHWGGVSHLGTVGAACGCVAMF